MIPVPVSIATAYEHPVITGPVPKAGVAHRLFEKPYEISLSLYANYSVSADGQRFLMVK